MGPTTVTFIYWSGGCFCCSCISCWYCYCRCRQRGAGYYVVARFCGRGGFLQGRGAVNSTVLLVCALGGVRKLMYCPLCLYSCPYPQRTGPSRRCVATVLWCCVLPCRALCNPFYAILTQGLTLSTAVHASPFGVARAAHATVIRCSVLD